MSFSLDAVGQMFTQWVLVSRRSEADRTIAFMLHIPLWIADILFALFVTALVETAIISAFIQLCLYFSFQ